MGRVTITRTGGAYLRRLDLPLAITWRRDNRAIVRKMRTDPWVYTSIYQAAEENMTSRP